MSEGLTITANLGNTTDPIPNPDPNPSTGEDDEKDDTPNSGTPNTN